MNHEATEHDTARSQGLTDRFLSPKQVHTMTGLSVTTRWRLERAREFPQARQISPQRVAYLESEVLAWMRDRPMVRAEKPQAEAA